MRPQPYIIYYEHFLATDSQGGINVPAARCRRKGGVENVIFVVAIFWPIFPGLDPGPAQGMTWASLGLDPSSSEE